MPVHPRRCDSIRRTLIAWFEANGRDLPWRKKRSPYRVWISEIMAQQTRLATVVPYFERFTKKFPDVKSLAMAPLDEVLALWSGLGYYRRARHLHAAAKVMLDRHNGKVPGEPEELLSLPGIGRYTAGAIASISYGIPVPILDGNVMRVLTRLFDLDLDISSSTSRGVLWDLAEELVPGMQPGVFNEAMMELGATVCTPGSPDCPGCPLKRSCLARRAETVERRPVKTAKKPPVKSRWLAGAVRSPDGALLLTRNQDHGLFSGLWQLPAHRVRGKMALQRRLEDSLSAQVSVGEKLGTVEHVLTHRHLVIDLYACTLSGKEISSSVSMKHDWIRAKKDIRGKGLASMTRKLLALAGFDS
jgi:A/G-specific adenine glycosylase